VEEWTAGEGDDLGCGGVGEALGEDFSAYEAGVAGEDDFHGWFLGGDDVLMLRRDVLVLQGLYHWNVTEELNSS
jgi:hypothetical protein